MMLTEPASKVSLPVVLVMRTRSMTSVSVFVPPAITTDAVASVRPQAMEAIQMLPLMLWIVIAPPIPAVARPARTTKPVVEVAALASTAVPAKDEELA